MKQHITFDTKYCKSYKTYEKAVKVAETLLDELQEECERLEINPRFIIMQDNETQRHMPVFLNTLPFFNMFSDRGHGTLS